MAKKAWDPLNCLPSAEVIREKLAETLLLAERLRILLEVRERSDAVGSSPADKPPHKP